MKLPGIEVAEVALFVVWVGVVCALVAGALIGWVWVVGRVFL